MADPTMQDPVDPSADPSADPSSGGGYTIEITVTADGKISVGVESADEENEEESSAGGASAGSGADGAGTSDDESTEPTEGAAQPAKNIKDALVMALEIYKNNGASPGVDDSDSQFQSGFGGGQS